MLQLAQSKFYGVEIDSISGRIGKLLYPESDIQIKGFEETSFSNNFFDAVIGNVPFGEYKVNDREYNKNNFLIHDYFFAKSIDKVRNGGIIGLIGQKTCYKTAIVIEISMAIAVLSFVKEDKGWTKNVFRMLVNS